MYALRASLTLERWLAWDDAGRRLCDLSASRSTDRCVVAVNGRDGCVDEKKYSVNDVDDVVGSVNGNGIVAVMWRDEARRGAERRGAVGKSIRYVHQYLGIMHDNLE